MPSPECLLHNLKRLVRCTANPPTAEILADLSADWMGILGDMSDQDLDAAVVAYLRAPSPFWPTPGQLLALTPQKQLAAIDDAEEAWEHVCAITARNAYAEPPTGALDRSDRQRDAALQTALRSIGGAKGLGQSLEATMHYTRRTFLEVYRNARKNTATIAEVNILQELSDRMGGRLRIGGGRGDGMRPLLGEIKGGKP